MTTLFDIIFVSFATGTLLMFCCNGCGFQQKPQPYFIIQQQQQPPSYTETEPSKTLLNI